MPHRHCAGAVAHAIFGPEAPSHSKSMRHAVRKVLVGILILFLLPLAVHAALYASKDRPASFRDADWSSVGMLPPADADRDARFLVFTGRTGRWKGIFAVHSWVVFKPDNATSWSRYDVVGWGQPVRTNGWAPDGRWFGDTPRVLVDVRGPAAAALIPKVKAAIAAYGYSHSGDYRIWPGPNSNTFAATVLRAVPELEATLWGLLGVKFGWVEGIEVNVLGLVAGLDLRHPAVKLPGFGRVGVEDGTAVAAPARAK